MSETDEIITAYSVVFNDEWLGIEDFRTIRAESEEEARSTFEEEYAEEGRHEVVEVEEAYQLNKTKVDNLLDSVPN